jgi:hypothetical protein
MSNQQYSYPCGAAGLLSLAFIIGGCDDVSTMPDERPETPLSAEEEHQASERADFLDAQLENEELGDWGRMDTITDDQSPVAGPENPAHLLRASGSIFHGGAAFQEARVYHTRGGLCSAGRVRAAYTANHQGNGWGGFHAWLSPSDLTDCRAIFWTQNAAGFVNGTLFWYIYEENAVPGHYDYCRAFGPCAEDEGDCDSDSECEPGLTCESNIGGEYGWASDIDVCTSSLPNGHYNYCATVGPCEPGEGDCDGNSECLSPWVCGNNNGPAYGFDASVDVCH